MKIIRNPEIRGILALLLVILLIAAALALVTGKLETWFGITIGGGPRLLDKVVFVSDESGSADICFMNPDGSDRQKLTTGANVMSAPFVSPSGHRVVYVGLYENAAQVFSVSNGGEPGVLTSASGAKTHPQFTPNGKRLSFISSGSVYVGEPNGDNLDKILPTATQTRLAMLRRGDLPAFSWYAWAPDGERMAAVMKGANDSDILVVLTNNDEAQEIPVSPQPCAEIGGLAWSPDGSSLVIAVTEGKKSFLGDYNFEEKRARVMVAVQLQKFSDPVFSPDGSKVVCVVTSNSPKSPSGLMELDASIGQAKMIARGNFAKLSYSPDGSQLLATVSDASGETRDVALIDQQTGSVDRLTKDGHSFDAVWSPAESK